MTQYLPEPGSIWNNRGTGRPMRVVMSDLSEIVAHDCELTMRTDCEMTSWAGQVKEFFQMFQPCTEKEEDLYPATAR